VNLREKVEQHDLDGRSRSSDVAAIVYFEKVLEDVDTVTYRYGHDEEDLRHSFTISKADARPIMDPDKATMAIQLALGGIMRSYRKHGRWPERGAGVT
jgi:hypothetical protein